MSKKIVIIGAGIGGLTMALALQRIGYATEIYEGASEIRPVGAGILMANNAMQIFEKLGVRKKIEKAGHQISKIYITNSKFQILSETDLSRFESKYGVYNVAIHRADLQHILANEIGYEYIKLSKRLSKIEKNNDFKLTFEDGTAVHCEAVIAADGIHSVVRNQIFGSAEIRDTNQRCWRGVCEVETGLKFNHKAYEAWNKGKRFGFTKINENKLYWYAVVNEHLVGDSIETIFEGFHPDILEIISKTKKEYIAFHPIIDLKPFSNWYQGKLCLIGDAAHATTPNMGQGACQAVEDAYVIAKLLEEGKSIEQAFAHYHKLRIKKAHYVVNTSWFIGKVSHYENEIAVYVRNNVMKMVLKFAQSRQFDKVFDINY